jgi:hypothetical protein
MRLQTSWDQNFREEDNDEDKGQGVNVCGDWVNRYHLANMSRGSAHINLTREKII